MTARFAWSSSEKQSAALLSWGSHSRLAGMTFHSIVHEITPDPINSSPSYQAANCPGVTPRCGLSNII